LLGSLRAVPETSEAPRRRRVLGLDPAQRQAERRRLVLVAALDLFGTQGYGRTSIESLCQTAGVGTNSFYDLFSSKEDVFVELYDEVTSGLRDAVAEAYADQRRPGVDPVRPLVGAFVHAAVDDPRIAQVAFIEAAGISPRVEEHRRQIRNQFVTGLQAIGSDLRDAAILATGRPETAIHAPEVDAPSGTRAGPSPRRNAVALVGSIVELTVDWLHDPDPDPIDALIDDISHHCRRMLAAIIDETTRPSE
jgi:AcrR family transcriptional regulator